LGPDGLYALLIGRELRCSVVHKCPLRPIEFEPPNIEFHGGIFRLIR
jgi:hypothetical protein